MTAILDIIGRGILDSKSILAALLKIKYQGLVGFEYEKDAKDPVPGLAESVGYIKGLLAGTKLGWASVPAAAICVA